MKKRVKGVLLGVLQVLDAVIILFTVLCIIYLYVFWVLYLRIEKW